MNKFKIALATVMLAIAIALLWGSLSYDAGAVLPDDDSTKTLWMCSLPECGQSFFLTARQAQQAMEKGPQPWPPAICPQCKNQKAYQAQQCPDCGTKYFGSEVPGYTGACPKCHPEVRPLEEFLSPEDEDDPSSGPTPDNGDAPPRPRPKTV